ncbi:MAG: saccharopine dehydrogenase NADP-binding domain-containing protein [Moraxellaceae bacterium]|nr:saccharopine dehydrogenase NADP-binding domain-containing protein [Moraxellaceae bacterium]
MQWMIYGANGYTGELIAREAARRGLFPILAGRNKQKLHELANELGLPYRTFPLTQAAEVHESLIDIGLVLHCAGPFSVTAEPMQEACLTVGAHYLDITGEISVFELTHSRVQSARARKKGIVLCSGVGFDVIPTDCVALRLKELMPDATHLSLGFDSDLALSPGTTKTLIEGLGAGCVERVDGKLKATALGSRHRHIDFGRGARSAMTIPWGDVSTAYYTTGIPNIQTWIPMPSPLVFGARGLSFARPLLQVNAVQKLLKKLVERFVCGPDEAARAVMPTLVWGEAKNAAGDVVSVCIDIPNIYSMTVDGALHITSHLLQSTIAGGSYTPAVLFGSSFITKLPGSGNFKVIRSYS